MSIKDEINKGFTVGDITTTKYDDEAKIKVKDFYDLDKLNRGKVLQLAGLTDIELAERDIRIDDLENNAGGSGGLTQYSPPAEINKLLCVYSKVIVKSIVDDMGIVTMDKYNALSVSDKSNVNYSIQELGITTPITIEKIKVFLTGNPTGIGLKDLSYLYKYFTTDYEIEDINLELEYYYSSSNDAYKFDRSEYLKVLIPKLHIYKDKVTNQFRIYEKEVLGTWNKTRGLENPAYFGQEYPLMLSHKVLGNGDYEIYFYILKNSTENYYIKTNKIPTIIESTGLIGRCALRPIISYNFTSITYNKNNGFIPCNLDFHLSGILVTDFQYLNVSNEVSTQASRLKIDMTLLNDKTFTATTTTDLKIILFANLGWGNIANEFSNMDINLNSSDITGKPDGVDSFQIIVTRNTITLIVKKGTSITLRKAVQYSTTVKAITAF